MTEKLKNRLQKMHFQKQNYRRTEVEDIEDTKYYEEILSNKIKELLGLTDENISRTARGSLRPQHI